MTTPPIRLFWLATLAPLCLAAGCGSSNPLSGTDAGTEVDARVALPGPGPECQGDLDCYFEDAEEPESSFTAQEGTRCVEGGCGCLSNADCAFVALGAVCDTATRGCRLCVADAECGDGDLRCVGGECVECVDSSECGGATPACADGLCSECADASDCAASTRGTRCSERACGCDSSADCLDGLVCGGSTCIPACTSNDDCDGEPCDTATGECVECVDDGPCAGNAGGTSCLAASRTCGCSTDAHCAGSPLGTACIVHLGACGCVSHLDCPMDAPICNALECVAP